MAPLSARQIAPRKKISPAAIPKPAREAITHIFADCKDGVWLVGGTALAGFYAEHRRSDDIDLFAADENHHRAAVLSAKSLQKLGAVFSKEMQTPQYFRTDILWQGHAFTIDIVLDENIHRIGNALRSEDGVLFADLNTLFSMKAACLVSRASEKDLFDMDWIFTHTKAKPDAAELVTRGSKIDGGVTIETLLVSLKGAILRKEACHFLLPNSELTPEKAYKKILAMRKYLVALLLKFEKKAPLSPDIAALAMAMKEIKHLKN